MEDRIVRTQFIITDFESAMMKALEEEMDDFGAELVTCYFHFKQSIRRRIQTHVGEHLYGEYTHGNPVAADTDLFSHQAQTPHSRRT